MQLLNARARARLTAIFQNRVPHKQPSSRWHLVQPPFKLTRIGLSFSVFLSLSPCSMTHRTAPTVASNYPRNMQFFTRSQRGILINVECRRCDTRIGRAIEMIRTDRYSRDNRRLLRGRQSLVLVTIPGELRCARLRNDPPISSALTSAQRGCGGRAPLEEVVHATETRSIPLPPLSLLPFPFSYSANGVARLARGWRKHTPYHS